MTATTQVEKKLVLKLFKDFNIKYNPSNISKEINNTRVGTYKALHALEEDSIVISEQLGKAFFYNIDFDNEYALKNVELLLMEEAKDYVRWIKEFKDIFDYVDIAVLFGSVITDEKKANDIDLLLVYDEGKNRVVKNFINKKNEILIKKIHPVVQTKDDFIKNIKKRDSVVLDAIKTGVVLHGYEKFVRLIKNVRN